MKHNISTLFEFIDTAEHNRNYAPATARGYRAALKLFENVSNEDERESVEVFKSRIEQIYRQVFAKNSKEFKAASLQVYKSRVLKIISDFEKYGVDPTKLANWTSAPVVRGPRKEGGKKQKKSTSSNADNTDDGQGGQGFSKQEGMQRSEMPIRPGINAVLVYPSDLTAKELEKIKNYLNLLPVQE